MRVKSRSSVARIEHRAILLVTRADQQHVVSRWMAIDQQVAVAAVLVLADAHFVQRRAWARVDFDGLVDVPLALLEEEHDAGGVKELQFTAQVARGFRLVGINDPPNEGLGVNFRVNF
jgi:hypothetical protein